MVKWSVGGGVAGGVEQVRWARVEGEYEDEMPVILGGDDGNTVIGKQSKKQLFKEMFSLQH